MRQFNKSNKFSKRDSGRSSDRKSGERRFERDSRSEDRGKFDGRDRSRGSSFELHKAICDKCGKECEVPFKPTGGKPIYCRSCFKQNSSGSGDRSSKYESRSETNDRLRFKDNSRENFEPKGRSSPTYEDLERINKKLDKIMKALKIE
jgi:CxxC-x17-CxxC domain-containing protein